MLARYAKALVYILLTAVGFLTTALVDNDLTTEELLNLAVAVIGAVVVYAVPNLPAGWRQYSKAIAAFLTAAIVALLSVLTGGVNLTEWLQVVAAAFAGIGVYAVPNAALKDDNA